MKITNKLFLVLLLTLLAGTLLCAGFTASAEGAPENYTVIREGEPQTLSFSGNGRESVYLRFTPDETDSYTLSCTNENSVLYITLLDSEGKQLKTGYDIPSFLGYELPAEETYYYMVTAYDAITVDAVLTRTEDYMADIAVPLTPDGEVTVASSGQYVSFVPEIDDVYVLVVEDPYNSAGTFVLFDRNLQPLTYYEIYDDPCGFACRLSAGKIYYFRATRMGQIIRIESLQSYSAAMNWGTLTLDEPYPIAADESDTCRVLPFTPTETTLYTLLSDDGFMVCNLAVFDSDFKVLLRYPFDAASSYTNIRIYTELVAGKTYYLALDCRSFEPSTGFFTVTAQTPSGTCGEGLTWTFENNTLTISGTGILPDYSDDTLPAPWALLRKKIKALDLKNGITRIGNKAFYNCSNLTSVTIPDSVTEIGSSAFYDCFGLKQVDFGNGVTSIGELSFSGTDLRRVVLPDNITSIGENAFLMSNLEHVVISGGMTSISECAFGYCAGLKSVTIPDSVTNIDMGAFYECTALKDVFFRGSETEWNALTIGEYNDPLFNADIHYNVADWGYCGAEGDGTNLIWTLANDGTLTISGEGRMADYKISYPFFSSLSSIHSSSPWSGDTRVKKVILSPGVTTVGEAAFFRCEALEALELPASLTQLNSSSFFMCNVLKEIFFAGSEAQWNEAVTYYESAILAYGDGAFRNATVHYNVADWGYCGAEGDGTNLIWTLTNDGTLTVSGEGSMVDYKVSIPENGSSLSPVSSSSPWCGDSRIKKIVLSPGVTTVGKLAFLHCSALTELELPASLTRMYASSFFYCYALKNIFFAGSKAQWNGAVTYDQIEILLLNISDDAFRNAKVHFGVVAHGYCGAEGDGTNVLWVYYDTQTLVFSGQGAIKDYYSRTDTDETEGESYNADALPPWTLFNDKPTVIVLEEGITRVGLRSLIIEDETRELLVLNKQCDLSDLVIKEPAYLRGYLESTAESYANDHEEDCLFMPLCSTDYRHEVVVVPGDASTCTGTEHEMDVLCTECGKVLYSEFKPHVWSDWTVIKPATTEEDGSQFRACTVCAMEETATIGKLTDNGGNDDRNDDDGNVLRRAIKALVAWFQKLLRVLGML